MLTDRYTFEEVKQPEIHTDMLQVDKVFDCLNKKEIFDIVLTHFGGLPSVKPAFLRSECKKIFEVLPKEIVSTEFKKALKQREHSGRNKKHLFNVPSSLLSLMYTANFSEKRYETVLNKLKQKIDND